jgi:aminopeptidase N
MKYRGKIIKRMGDYTFIETSIQWYPTYGYKQKSLFDITFTAPDNYKLISIGNKVSQEKKEGEIISRWSAEYPIRNASFNIGPFSTAVSDRKDVPPITLHYINSNNKENVLTDVAQAYEFYSKLFGTLPLQSVNATEIPYAHGEAFPGMLHLSWLTFESSNNSGAWQSFNAHETGHQWWGIGLDYKTYRDRWLSEGFTEYASLMYLQMMLGDNQKFFEILKKSRERIINAKKQRKSDGVDLCPISLGHRVASTSLTREDYHTVIYEKGAWTLHMLRNILLNLNTMNEDGFKTIMKDFFTTYQGKSATIADFQKIVEKNVNQDVSWFFDQWVHGTQTPVYHFAYKTEKQPDDKFKVRVRIIQKEVSPDFKMSVPIKIVFDNGSIARIRVFITGEKSEFDLPPLASAPKEIILNDLESVLATVEIDDWE